MAAAVDATTTAISGALNPEMIRWSGQKEIVFKKDIIGDPLPTLSTGSTDWQLMSRGSGCISRQKDCICSCRGEEVLPGKRPKCRPAGQLPYLSQGTSA